MRLNDQRTVIWYIGVDGSYWSLSGPDMGAEGVKLGTDPNGIYHAPVKTVWDETAYQEGATYRKKLVQKRVIDWTVHLIGTGVSDVQEVHRQWWAAWDYDRDGFLCVFTTGAGWRWLKVRLMEEPKKAPKRDLLMTRASSWDMMVAAGDPWWRSEDLLASWSNSAGLGAGTLQVANRGTEAAHPTYAGTAPGQWTLPDGSVNGVKLPVLKAGQDWLVDTDPMQQTLTVEDEAPEWANMDGRAFLDGIAAGTEVSLPVRITGGSTASEIEIAVPQKFSRHM